MTNELRVVLSLCLLAWSVQPSLGHASMIYPVPRHLCKESTWSGGYDAGHGGGWDGGEGGLPSFCGDPFAGPPGGDFYKHPCPPQAQFEEGSTITLIIDITTNHGGHFQFAVCPEGELTQECFDKYTLRDAFHGGVSWFVPKYPTNTPKTQSRMVLPDGLTCENCVLMWTWWTAEVCVHECDPVECNTYSEGINGVYHTSGNGGSGMPKCPAIPSKGEAPQIYRNCADIQIVPKGSPLTMPFKMLKSRTGRETTSEMSPAEPPQGDWTTFPSATLTGTSSGTVKFSTVTTTAIGAPPPADMSGLPPSAPMPKPYPGSVSYASASASASTSSSTSSSSSTSGSTTVSAGQTRQSPPPTSTYTPPNPPPSTTTTTTTAAAGHSTFGAFLGAYRPPPPAPAKTQAPPPQAPATTTTASASTTAYTGGWGAFFSSRRLSSLPLVGSFTHRLQAREASAKPYATFPDGLNEIDPRGKAAMTPVNDGSFSCKDETVRKVLRAMNEKRHGKRALPLLCSNKATGGAHTLAQSMCMKGEPIHDKQTQCMFSELGEGCKDAVVIGVQESPLEDMSEEDEEVFLKEYGVAAGVGYKACGDGRTYWALFMG